MNNRAMLTRIAWLYYYEDLSQQEIGEMLGIPRIKVTRLLKNIRDEKIVEIKIKSNHFSLFSLEKRFRETTGLENITIVPSGKVPGEFVAQAMAAGFLDACARYEKIGIGASRIVARGFGKIEGPITKKKVKYFVSLTGNAMPNFAANTYSAGWRLSEILGADFHHIWAPAIASTTEMASVLRKDLIIEPVLALANSVDVAFIGLGDIRNSLIFSHGFLAPEEVEVIISSGAVGEIFGHFYAIDGKLMHTAINERTVCADFPMKCPIYATAYGDAKVLPIAGAIRGGYLHGLITDEKTALLVLNAGW